MQRQRLQLDDVELAYLSWGEPASPPLLLLHGYLDVADVWRGVAESLASDFFVVAPHFRGHGDSGWCDGFSYMMPNYLFDLTRLIDALGWPSLSLAGHSMGGNCASLWAGTFPQRVERLVILEGFGVPFWTPEQTPEKLLTHLQERAKPPRPHRTFSDLEDVRVRLRNDLPHASEEGIANLALARVRQEEDGLWRWKSDPRLRWSNPVMYLQSQFEAFWKRITCPTLQLLGAESSFLAWLEPSLFASIPQMQGLVIPLAGHSLHAEQPEAIASAMRTFLFEKEPSSLPIVDVISSLL